MATAQAKRDTYNYAQYLDWNNGEQWEFIEGVPYDMSPAPGRRHQKTVMTLSSTIFNFLKGKKCEVYPAPFDVRLAEDYSQNELIDTVVQPDISVFCDLSKLDEKGAKGAPDWVIEVLSESTKDKDINTKLLLYQKYGVKEYWIIDPEKLLIYTYTLDKTGKYPEGVVFQKEQVVTPSVFPELNITVSSVLAYQG